MSFIEASEENSVESRNVLEALLRNLVLTARVNSRETGPDQVLARVVENDDFVYVLTRTSRAKTGSLTDRERGITKLVTTGLSNHQVAEKLGIERRAVAAHLRRVFQKLGVGTRAELTLKLRSPG